MELLPEDCMGHIFSFLSPTEACRIRTVSLAAQSVVDSDTVWEKFLPSDYKDIIYRLVCPVEFSSKKELFFKLCNPLFIDNGSKMFWLDKRTAKKCYTLGARELSIAWSSHPLFWSWKPLAGSRFTEAAELRTIWWLEIQGSIRSSELSPNTTYRVYLIVQIANRAYGLEKLPSEVTIEVGKHKLQTNMYLSKHNFERKDRTTTIEDVCNRSRTKITRFGNYEEQNQTRVRQDGFIEIELGEFYNSRNKDQEIKMSLREVKGASKRWTYSRGNGDQGTGIREMKKKDSDCSTTRSIYKCLR